MRQRADVGANHSEIRPIDQAPVKLGEEFPGRFMLWDRAHPLGVVGRWNGVGWFDFDGERLAPLHWWLIPPLADLSPA